MSRDSKKLEASPSSLLERGLGGEVYADKTNWQAWYWLVLGALAAEVAFFTYLTRAFTT
jgi:hypothetical protein